MRPKKPESRRKASLSRPGRNSLSCTTPFLRPLALASFTPRPLRQIGRDRLLAIDMLAGLDRLRQQRRPHLRGARHRRRSCRPCWRAPCRDRWPKRATPMRLASASIFSALRPIRIGSGITRSPFGEQHAALLADRQDRADQMLVHPHAAGDAVHDDAETFGASCSSAPGDFRLDGRVAAPWPTRRGSTPRWRSRARPANRQEIRHRGWQAGPCPRRFGRDRDARQEGCASAAGVSAKPST